MNKRDKFIERERERERKSRLLTVSRYKAAQVSSFTRDLILKRCRGRRRGRCRRRRRGRRRRLRR